MVELVDALASGASESNLVGVRVPFWAHYKLRFQYGSATFCF